MAISRASSEATKRNILTDFCYELGTRRLDRAPVFEYCRRKRFDVICVARQGGTGHRLCKVDEILVFCNEVRLRIDLDDRCLVAIDCNCNTTVRRNPACLLVSFRLSGLSQQFDRIFHIAAGLDQCFLALHHSGAGPVAEFLNHRCTN
jgi:hypothetical protein